MTIGPSSGLSEVSQIIQSLDVLLKAAIVPPPRKDILDQPVSAAAFDIGKMLGSRAEQETESILRDPLGYSARLAITILGERLYEIGGLDLMGDVCDRVANLDPPAWGRRTSIMDHRWDGVGRTDGNPGWCS